MADLRLLLLLFLGFILIPLKGPDIRITFIDVGQGDSIFLDAGEDILIDGGSSSSKKIGKYTLEPFLKSRRTGSIEKLFVTHADSDHINGLTYLAENSSISIEEVYLPACAINDERYDELKEALCPSGTDGTGPASGMGKISGVHTHISYIKSGDVIPLEKGSITCMAPAGSEYVEDMNVQSLILLYRCGNFTALLTGDADKDCEFEMLDNIDSGSLPDISNVTVLKTGHHGSSTSTCEELIKACTPLAAVLSYGEGNRYGHPHEETLELLDRYHVRTIHTARSGAVTMTTDGNDKVTVDCFISDDDTD